MKLLVTFFLLLSSAFVSIGQTVRTIEVMSLAHQDCLDEGKHMLACSKFFYMQMDSMLNVAYNKLRATMTIEERAALKKDQLVWLKKRDNYFKEQQQEFDENFKKGEWGNDMYMVTYDNDAEFVKERVIVLLKRLKK